MLYNPPLKSNRVDPASPWKRLPICTERRLFLIPLAKRGVGREGGKWGNLEVLDEQLHGEKSQFGKQRWNRNLWSPLCLCHPEIPTAIKAKEREATGKSNKSLPRVDALGLTNKCITFGQMERYKERDRETA